MMYLKVLLIPVMLFACSCSFATTYYFSSSNGNDAYTALQAQHHSTPWRSLEKLQAMSGALLPGDSVLFRRNDVFTGSIDLRSSGAAVRPIVFSAYGSGKDPVITGFTVISAWVDTGNGIWETPFADKPTNIRVNGSPVLPGRYPLKTAGNGGYLRINSTPDPNSIERNAADRGNDWSGADLIIRKNRWVIDKAEVTGSSPSLLNYKESSSYQATTGFGYFITNHRATLVNGGDWYYNRITRKVGIRSDQKPLPGSVLAVSVPILVNISNARYLNIEQLAFDGSSLAGISIRNSNNISITGCSFTNSGNTAIRVASSAFLRLNKLTINNSANIALDLNNSDEVIVSHCTITNTGMEPGLGQGDSGSYEALLLSGDRQVIEYNRIINTGYNAIAFRGNDVIIRNNFIDSFGLVKDDGGGVYTWNNDGRGDKKTGRFIECNIILNGLGAPAGTTTNLGQMNGVYIDDNADGIVVADNSLAYNSQYGLYIHNANNLEIRRNKVYGNQLSQLGIIHDPIAGPVHHLVVLDNQFVSNNAGQAVAIFRTTANDIAAFGTIDSNFYYNPFNNNNPITASSKDGWAWHNLDTWQKSSGHDRHSRTNSLVMDPYTIINKHKLFTQGFGGGQGDLYAYASDGSPALQVTTTGPLTNDQLRISYQPRAGSKATLVARVGPVKKSKFYLLELDMAGLGDNTVDFYLRQSKEPYSDLSDRFTIRGNKSNTYRMLFQAAAKEADASIAIDITHPADALYLDNIRLSEVSVSSLPPTALVPFLYNDSPSAVLLQSKGTYLDVTGRAFNGRLEPYQSVILVKEPAR